MNILDTVLKPATGLMNRLSFSKKVGLIGVLFMIPLAYVGFTLHGKYAEELEFARMEQAGVRQVSALAKVLQPLQAHRGLSRVVLSGDTSATAALDEAARKIESAMVALEKSNGQDAVLLKIQKEIAEVRSSWNQIASTGKSISVAQNRELHNKLVDKLFLLITKAADNSNLTLDPELESYYLMDMTVFRLPVLVENLGQARAIASAAAKEKTISLEQRIELAKLAKAVAIDHDLLKTDFEKIASSNATLKAALEGQMAATERDLVAVQRLLTNNFILAEKIEVDPATLFKTIATVAKGMNETFELGLDKLDKLLLARIARVNQQMASAFVVAAVVLILVAFLFAGFMTATRKSMNTLTDGARRVAAGDLSASINTGSRDELGEVAQSFQSVQTTLNAFLAAQLDMGKRHEAGMISHRIAVEQFSGAYAQAATQTNDLVQGHIDTKMKVVEIARRYAIGDLSVDMPVLPGEKLVLTNSMAEMKQNLGAINREILKLSEAASRGDFSVRGDEDQFQHDFKAMVHGMNGLMETCQSGLAEIATVLEALARGDLTHRAHEGFQGTFAEVIGYSRKTSEDLTRIIAQIQDASTTINVGSQEIAAGNQNLSQRTEEQASSLQETAASMEELTQTVRQNAENSKQANQLAIGASEVAQKGGEMVGQVVGTMASINESSRKIVDIISVIDGIAFQTNILALNAAVEAARAGEQGRGFAVVATEVRNLAHRSASAAKEIKSLIGDSVGKVEAGTKLVESAGTTMEEIVISIKRVSDIVAEISAASQEQSAGIGQISDAITQMDQVTQQNAALVEQAAAAAESMRDQAAAMSSTVSVFVVDGARPPSSASAAPKASTSKALSTAAVQRAVASSGPQRPAASSDEWEEF